MHRALVVEDDASLRALVRTLLEAEGFRVVVAETAGRALIEARAHQPDVVVVDLGLPDRDGHDVIRAIRAWSPMPILVLSARTAEAEKVAALDEGADDFVTKPFGARELLARVRAVLRRNVRTEDAGSALVLGDVRLDLARREAVGPDGPLHFTPLEFRVLECLARGRGRVVPQEQLIREVWGPERVTDTRGLRAYVKTLRQKLEPDPARPRHLVTEVGVGYRLVADETATRSR
jgi:two-component system KDP operon response regulator KdpE